MVENRVWRLKCSDLGWNREYLAVRRTNIDSLSFTKKGGDEEWRTEFTWEEIRYLTEKYQNIMAAVIPVPIIREKAE